jgi:hypothetical protein
LAIRAVGSVIVADAIVTGAVSVQTNGSGGGDPATVRVRVKGTAVVNCGKPTLTAPDAPAVIGPLTVPLSATIGTVGAVAGKVKEPDSVMDGVPVPPVTVSGTDPVRTAVLPAGYTANTSGGKKKARPRPVSGGFKTVAPETAEFGTSAGFATSKTGPPELTGVEIKPSATLVGCGGNDKPRALHVKANGGVIVAEAIVTGAVSVQTNGISTDPTVLMVRVRVKGAAVVNCGKPTLTVPDAPAVIGPLTVPLSATMGTVGAVAGTAKDPDSVMDGVPVPPVTVSGTDPERPMVLPAGNN